MGFVEENGPSPRVINNTLKAGQSMLVPEGLLHSLAVQQGLQAGGVHLFNLQQIVRTLAGVLTVAFRLLSIPTNERLGNHTRRHVRQREAVRLDSD